MALTFLRKVLSSGFGTTDDLNENFEKIETAIDAGLSRKSNTDNAMEVDLDMNSNRILNLPTAITAGEPVTYSQWTANANTLTLTGFLKETQTAAADNQTIFNFSVVSWTVAAGQLLVFINGVFQPTGYTETDTNTITFSTGLTNGDEVTALVISEA